MVGTKVEWKTAENDVFESDRPGNRGSLQFGFIDGSAASHHPGAVEALQATSNPSPDDGTSENQARNLPAPMPVGAGPVAEWGQKL
jgi:hypothetical protein